MPPQLVPSNDLSITTLGQDIAAFKQGQSMFFVLNTQEILEFKTNPVDIQEERGVVEASFPTKGGWYVFRWMNQPTMWTIRGYAGTQGRDIEALLSKLEGQVNVVWICNYVKDAGSKVRIISVKRPKSNQAPFSIYYEINFQNLETTVFGNLGAIIPNRVTSAFVSPSIAVGFGNIDKTGKIVVTSSMLSINDVATYIIQNGLSSLSFDSVVQSLHDLNPGLPETWTAISFNLQQLIYAK